jgi:nucleotide-binding universal stress UspA family protein
MTAKSRNIPTKGNILVPIDFSETSISALRFAGQFATYSHSSLTLLHVVPTLLGGRFLPNTLLRTTAEKNLASLVRKHLGRLSHKILIDEGSAFQQICKVAESEDSSMIIMSTHGYTGYKHTLLGSTAERVIRYAPCPTFVLGANARLPKTQFKRILVPVDFSKNSKPLLAFALKFARSRRARVSLCHTVELPLYAPQAGPNMEVLTKEMIKQAAGKLKTLFNKLPAGMRGSQNVRVGDAFDEIAREAKERKSDLIIIATHGFTGIQHMLLGSTTEKVLRSAPCPVLVKRMEN